MKLTKSKSSNEGKPFLSRLDLPGVFIEQEIRTALAENYNRLGGLKVALKILDHHDGIPWAKRDQLMYLKAPFVLTAFSGLGSPAPLATRGFITVDVSKTNQNVHEALVVEDFVMAHFAPDYEIILYESP